MKRFQWNFSRGTLLLFLLLPSARGGIGPAREGILQAGGALDQILNPNDRSASLLTQCEKGASDLSFFSKPCQDLLDQLQKKIALLLIESDIQIQAEHLTSKPRSSRVLVLTDLMSASRRALDSISAYKQAHPENHYSRYLDEILPIIGQVKSILARYQEFQGHAKP